LALANVLFILLILPYTHTAVEASDDCMQSFALTQVLITTEWFAHDKTILTSKLFDATTQAWKQTSGDPSGQTQHYRGVTLLYKFMTALLYMVLSVTTARIVATLLTIY